MKHTLLMLVIALAALTTNQAFADCEYQGESYATLEGIVRIDPAYYDLTYDQQQRVSKDAYVLVLICTPSVEVSDFEGKDWSMNDIKVKRDVWTIKHDQFHYSGANLRYPDGVVTVKSRY